MRPDHDTIARLFARLTGELEDTCELAVEGQNPRLPLSRRSNLATRLHNRLRRAETILGRIDAAIARLGEFDR